jgi:hypothetical protein
LSLFLQTHAIQQFESTHLTTQAQKAHYLSKTGPHATAFLQTVQSERAMTFSNKEFQVILYTYLQLDILSLFKADPNNPCICGGVDARRNLIRCTEDHLLNCQRNNGFTRRHDAIKEILIEMFRNGKLSPESEKQCDIGSGRFSRFDITVDGLIHTNKILNMDLTIPNPLAKKQVAHAAKTALHAAETYVTLKNEKYNQYVDENSFFTPLVIETFGAMHPLMEGIIRRTSHRVNHTPPERATWTAPTFCAYYFQRISCALQKMNAQAITNLITASANLKTTSRMNDQAGAFRTADHAHPNSDGANNDIIDLTQDLDDGSESQL